MKLLKKMSIATISLALAIVTNAASAKNDNVTQVGNAAPAVLATETISFKNPTSSFTSNFTTPILSGSISNANPLASVGQTAELITKAKTFIGLPYRYGGTSPTSGFDCSGFMQYVYKHTANINLPRRSQDMAAAGKRVTRDELEAGDMVFFSTRGGSISHVGMYIGNGQFIHSPRTGKSIEISQLNGGYYAKTFVTARRVLNEAA